MISHRKHEIRMMSKDGDKVDRKVVGGMIAREVQGLDKLELGPGLSGPITEATLDQSGLAK